MNAASHCSPATLLARSSVVVQPWVMVSQNGRIGADAIAGLGQVVNSWMMKTRGVILKAERGNPICDSGGASSDQMLDGCLKR